MNVENRQKMEKKIAMKSLVAERAAIDLINKFVDKSGVPLYDESGKFQLPPDKITEDNWRVEEFKPIDKVKIVYFFAQISLNQFDKFVFSSTIGCHMENCTRLSVMLHQRKMKNWFLESMMA